MRQEDTRDHQKRKKKGYDESQGILNQAQSHCLFHCRSSFHRGKFPLVIRLTPNRAGPAGRGGRGVSRHAVDYLTVHELVHLREPNHGDAFCLAQNGASYDL